MVDNTNPTSQFHPYQPPEEIPQPPETGGLGGLGGILRKAGIDPATLSNIDVKGSVEKARGIARRNPGLVLGGLAAAAIGLGLMRKKKRTKPV